MGPFQVKGIHYSYTQQYIQCSKAQSFDDYHANHRIMKETDPYRIKQIGFKIKHYQEE